MKMTKKIMSLAIVFAMVMAMSVSVFAADNNTITVTGAQANETYKAYKMLDLSVNLTNKAYTYTVNENWTTFFAGEGAAYITKDGQGYVTAVTDVAGLAQAAAKFAANLTADDEVTPTANNDAVLEGLTDGYYLITSTNGSIAMIETTPDNQDVKINEKNYDHTVTKKVQEDDTSAWLTETTANTAQIGDTVEYKITINVKKGAKNLVLHDVMDSALTLNAESIAIEGLVKDTDYTVATTTDGCTFEIDFDDTYLNGLTTDVVLTLTYDAVLNGTADHGVDYINKVKLTWGDNSETAWDSVKTNTFKFEVKKYASNDTTKANLADATFQLKKGENVVMLIKESDTVYRVANGAETGAVDSFTTVSAGNIVITGVDTDADYTLVETVAPAGYNLLAAPVNVGAVAAANTTVVEVANSSGTELPSTGGIGTTIFYALGGLMAVGAGVLLVAKKRMEA